MYIVWKKIGPPINPNKKRKPNFINKLLCDGEFSLENKKISDYMNKYFCNIGETLEECFPHCDEYKSYLHQRSAHTFFLFPYNTNEFTREIKALQYWC